MEYLNSFLLGIIQGLTEFLPVSSSAHLVIVPKLMKASEQLNSLSFDAFVHGGTLLAVLWYYRRSIGVMAGAFGRGLVYAEARRTHDFKTAVYILLATIPAVLAAFLFEKQIEGAFREPQSVGFVLIIFGVLLYVADRRGKKNRVEGGIKLTDVLIIGFAQAIALMPGVSRSGITITAAMVLGFKREDAASFSFLLSIPVIAGAFIHSAIKIMKYGTDIELSLPLTGFIAAAISGFFAISFLLKYIKKASFTPFVIYRIILGVFIIFIFAGKS